MSDAVEARLEELLSNTCVDPYGNPLPDCEQLERTHFLHGDSLIGISKLLILSGLYLNDNQRTIIYCNNI